MTGDFQQINTSWPIKAKKMRGINNMLNTLVVLVLIAAVLWVLWTIYQNGWDFKKGGAAIVAAAAAWWIFIHDSVSSLMSGM